MASRPAAALSTAPTKGTRPPPIRWSGWTAVRAHSSAPAAVLASASLSRWRTIQNSNGVFSVVPRREAEFVQHQLFRHTICFVIPPIDSPEILPVPLTPQVNPPQIVSGSGYILNGATLSPSVTFSTARYAGLTLSLLGCSVPFITLPKISETKEAIMFKRAIWAFAIAVCLAAPVTVHAQGAYLDVYIVKVKPEKLADFQAL